MKQLSIITFLLCLITARGYSQENEMVLLTIDDQPVTTEEFSRIYLKNNPEDSITRENMEKYLELFINFKLKVKEAKDLGLDTVQSFINELDGYKEQLASPYLTNQATIDKLVQQAYERMQWEVAASHIMVKCDENASPKDTANAYNKAREIRQRILNGEDFSTVAKGTSDDPSAKNNNGFIGYFSVFRMVYPFENAAFNMEIGEISQPVRTRFGYHVIKLEDKRPARGEIKAAHIMKIIPRESNEKAKEKARQDIFAIYDSLKAGSDFSELAMKHSDDKGSGRNGGNLGWFSTGRYVPDFEDVAFSLTSNGEFSEPFRTDFGWHIVQRIDYKQIPSFETAKKEIEQKVKRDSRSQLEREVLLSNLKKEYNFTKYPSALKVFYTLVDSSIYEKKWDPSVAEGMNETIFSFSNKKYTQEDFARYLSDYKNPEKNIPIATLVNKKFEEYWKKELLDHEKSMLSSKYPEYAHLLQEYHDGILLFNLTDQRVWSKAVEDTAGLETFYAKNKNNYYWKKRADVTFYSGKEKDAVQDAWKLVKKKSKKGITTDEVKEAICKDSLKQCLNTEHYLVEKGENELVDKFNWKKGITDIIEKDDKFLFGYYKDILSPQPKKLEEARGIITADYQDYLEKQWIEELRAKYKIEVNQKVFEELAGNIISGKNK